MVWLLTLLAISMLQPAPGPYDHSVDEREHTVEQWKELIYQEVLLFFCYNLSKSSKSGTINFKKIINQYVTIYLNCIYSCAFRVYFLVWLISIYCLSCFRLWNTSTAIILLVVHPPLHRTIPESHRLSIKPRSNRPDGRMDCLKGLAPFRLSHLSVSRYLLIIKVLLGKPTNIFFF